MAGKFENLIRSRRARLALAVTLAGTGLWAFAPYVVSEIGSTAYVNAPLLRIASPISGSVTTALPAAGEFLPAPRKLRLVTARSIDANGLGALTSQKAALEAALALAERQQAELVVAESRLAVRAGRYGSAAIARAAAGTTAAQADARACNAEAERAGLQHSRVLAIAAKGFASNATLESARATADAARANCAALVARAEAAASETSAARNGLYLGNGIADTPYMEQQKDRLLLRRQELQSIAADARARLADIGHRITAEEKRVAAASAFDLTLPGNAVVWALSASPGSNVVPGSAIIDLADCRHRFVEVTLPERRMEAILPGQKVRVRLIGSEQWEDGRVVRVSGAAARRDVAMVAASETDRDEGVLTAEVSLPAPRPGAAARRCDVGRLAEVRFPRQFG